MGQDLALVLAPAALVTSRPILPHLIFPNLTRRPRRQDAAFWAIVDANRSPEDSELADAIDRLGKEEGTDANGQPVVIRPDVVTIDKIALVASGEFAMWIRDPKNRRAIPHRMEECGYSPVRNKAAKDGLWKINDRRQAVYALNNMDVREQLTAAERLAGTGMGAR